jgi:hypothetical protein
MKRILATTLIVSASLFGLTACGDKDDTPANPLGGYTKQVDKANETKDTLDKQTEEINELGQQ